MNMFIDRVDKKPVPLLVVGLGGTGCDALLTVRKTFAERFNLPMDAEGQELPAPFRTAYLGFDILVRQPEGLALSEYVSILFPSADMIFRNNKNMLTPYEQSWMDRRLCLLSGYHIYARQAARLALSRSYEKVSEAIRGKLAEILAGIRDDGNENETRLEIAVITGIGGQTRSGIFLDMCQILRSVAGEFTKIPMKLTGWIVMPDVSLLNVSSASGMKEPILRNAYASLKELDFWMRVREHKVPYSMQYGTGSGPVIEWKDPPFDTCILMSGENTEGIPYRNGYQAVQETIAESLFHSFAEDDGRFSESYWDETILPAIRVRKSYPLFCGYRAVGVFTKQIPKQEILYYEGSLLLNTFIPKRDENSRLQPDCRLFTDGRGKPRAEEITGSGKQLMLDFRTNVCRLPVIAVPAVPFEGPAPHGMWRKWRDQFCSPAALKAAEEYLRKAWERFTAFAEGVIRDPEQGPFALEAYLDAPDGLLCCMYEILASWTNQYNKTRNQSIRQGEEMCEQFWPSYLNPPVLGRKSAVERYENAFRTLYTYVINCEFLEKHVAALEKLILRVKEYLRDGLKPMCAAILFLHEEFGRRSQPDPMLVQNICGLSTVQAGIDDAFNEANANNRMSSWFLDRISGITLETIPNADAKTSGVKFTCRETGLRELCKTLKDDLEEVYSSINSRSLDMIMGDIAGEETAAQQRWMDNLAGSALDSALPMFMQDTAFASGTKFAYCRMFIPQNAPEHLRYIRTAFNTHVPSVEPTASSLEDHLFVLSAWEKLPLFRYGLFEDLRKAYDNGLYMSCCEGLHLVQNGREDSDFRNDWSLLPSPKPYFLFTRSSTHREEVHYERIHSLAERGIACGMIHVLEEKPFASAEILLLHTGETLMTEQEILEKVREIETSVNPDTEIPCTMKEKCEKLKDLTNSAKGVMLEQETVSPVNAAAALGLEHEPCDPFDPAIRSEIHLLEKAKENYHRLCVLMTEAMLYLRPDLVQDLESQLPAWEKIAEETCTEGILWNERKTFAETAADIFLFLYNRIVPGPCGLMYKDQETSFHIVTPALLADDLKNISSDLLRAMCFLADAPADNAARADLTHMLEAAKRAFMDAVDDERITADELSDKIQIGKELIEDLREIEASLRQEAEYNPNLKESLNYQIDFAAELRQILERRCRTFRNIAKGL